MDNKTNYGFTTIVDAAAYMTDGMGLDSQDVRQALGELRSQFGRYEDLRGREYGRVARLVWERVTGCTFPREWECNIDEESEDEPHAS